MDSKRKMLAIMVALLMVALLGGLAFSCFGGKPNTDDGVKKVDAAAVYELERRDNVLASRIKELSVRTAAIEGRTTAMEENARTDRESVAKLAGAVDMLATKVIDKADRAELKKYARAERVGAVEQEVAAIKAAPPTSVAQNNDGVGTVTVRVRTVPVNADEE